MIVEVTPRQKGRRRVVMKCQSPSRVQQSHKHEVNINTIVLKALKGKAVKMMKTRPMYGDFTNVEDFHVSVNRVMEAQRDFMNLPSAVRKEFDNDPAKVIEFLSDDANIEKARELGLIPKEAPKEPKAAAAVADPPPKPE